MKFQLITLALLSPAFLISQLQADLVVHETESSVGIDKCRQSRAITPPIYAESGAKKSDVGEADSDQIVKQPKTKFILTSATSIERSPAKPESATPLRPILSYHYDDIYTVSNQFNASSQLDSNQQPKAHLEDPLPGEPSPSWMLGIVFVALCLRRRRKRNLSHAS